MTLPRPITLARAWDLVDSSLITIASAYPDLKALAPAGEIRRVEPLVSSIVLVASAADPARGIDALAAHSSLHPIRSRDDRRIVVTERSLPIEIVVADPAEYGSVLLRSTGSLSHLQQIESRMTIDRRHATEEDIYASLGLPFIIPELRHGTGEVAAAEENRLPKVIAQSQIRGDFHMHTRYSDGRDSV